MTVADGRYFELRGWPLMLRDIQGLGGGQLASSKGPTLPPRQAQKPRPTPATLELLQLTSGEVDFRADGCLLWHLGIIARVRFALSHGCLPAAVLSPC